MANSDKNILITPNTGSSTLSPTIVFRGANNTPVTLRTLDTGTISFEGTAGQLFSISDGLSGSIFSVNDISGIPSIEVLDTGLIKLNQYSGSTAFGSSAAIQNSFSVNAKVSISTVFPATPGLIIKSAASQTANLQEWQNSAGTVLALITPLGGITVSSDITQYGSGRTFIGGAADAGAFLNVGIPTASRQGIVVRANASQTANLQEWQNSAGTVLSRIDGAGSLISETVRASVLRAGNWASLPSGTVAAFSTCTTASTVGFIVKAATSQTANLQEWQNSAGSVLSYVDSAGKIFANGLRLDGSDGSNNNVYKTGTLGLLSGLGIQLYLNQDNNATGGSLVIRAMNAQTSNLTEWKNVAGTVLSLVDAYGRLGISTSILANSTGGYSQVSIANVNTTDTNLIIKGYASQTANLQEWQNSSGSVLLSVSSDGSLNKTGTLNIGPILSFANPGVGNETKFVFNKTNDSAYLTVKERSSDQTFYEFGMWDNALDGGDYFQWSMGQWSGGTGQGWMPIQLGYNTSPNGSKTQTLRFTGEQSVFWSPILTGTNTPYYTTTVNHSSNVDYEIFKYYPDTSATRTIPRTNASGGATLNIDLSGYTYSSRMGYKITVNSGGTTFDYSTYGGDNSSGTAIAITVGSWQTLSNGTKIKINGTPAASDDWQFLAFPTPRVSFGGSAEATALVTIKPSASDKGLVVKGAASQTANVFEVQDSTGAAMTWVSSTGGISLPRGSTFRFNAGIGVERAQITSNTSNDLIFGTAGGTQILKLAGGAAPGGATITVGTTTAVGLIVKGAASQTANLQEWQNSAGTVNARIDAYGTFQNGTATNYGAWINVQPAQASDKGIIIRGAASQSANLQEWQNSSGTLLAKIANNGRLTIKPIPFSGGVSGGIYLGDTSNAWVDGAFEIKVDNAGTPRFGFTAPNAATEALTINGTSVGVQTTSPSAVFQVTSNAAGNIASIIKGATSQTANLQEWQNSDGTVLASINASGNLILGNQYISYVGASAYGRLTLLDGGTNQTVLYPASAGLLIQNLGVVGMTVVKVKGVASQTANLTEWQNSSGTVLASIDASGKISAPSGIIAYTEFYSNGNVAFSGSLTQLNSLSVGAGNSISGRIQIKPYAANNIGIVVQGYASQTADLQQWQGSDGNALALVNSSGAIITGGIVRATNGGIFGGTSQLSTALTVYAQTSGQVGAIIRGATSQTANLQEWQNSSGTVLAYTRNDGMIAAQEVRTINNHVMLREENSGGYVNLVKATATNNNPGANQAKLYLRDGTNAGTLKLVVRAGAAGAETTILDNIPQS